ncbi:hypothetical protein DB346_16825 [Verrucomicrobia bacterium LW23]|nr:hypothetical protein DB346_16825 [Verrucomicrobia bacterium LW23]
MHHRNESVAGLLPFEDSSDFWHFASVAIGADTVAIPLTPGEFREGTWLTADFYNPHPVLLQIKLQFLPAEGNRRGEIIFGLYPQVRARLRIPGTALALNAWLLPREGALLKPMCGGDIVRPDEVATLRVTLLAGPEVNAGWWQTDWRVSPHPPRLLVNAESPHLYLLDSLGQAASRHWPEKISNESQMVTRLRADASNADSEFPAGWTRWGGSAHIRYAATGWFRTHHDGRRWWLVDPDGGAFWSAGLCCVSPLVEAAAAGLEHLLEWQPDEAPQWADASLNRPRGANAGRAINFLAANMIRAFGAKTWREEWRKLTIRFLRRRRFNTLGNWSDYQLGQNYSYPYTRPLRDIDTIAVPVIFRDFPDVFHPDFESGCAEWAQQLLPTRDDPAFIGYYICNEPTWSVARQTPAAGMLANTEGCYARNEFAAWLGKRYACNNTTLTQAWETEDATPAHVVSGRWERLPQSAAFLQDTMEFSALMTRRLFDRLGAACKVVDPHHLNLGARFAAPPADWLMDSFSSFDVFTFNSYSKKPRPAGGDISCRLHKPVLIGEWHFGATDTGMPAAGLETVATQQDRALAYRHFLESHAAQPWCVGVHWFTLYDQSAIGRYDGEPYNCGFLDVCHQEQPLICEAAQVSHEKMYETAFEMRSDSELPLPRYTRRLSL